MAYIYDISNRRFDILDIIMTAKKWKRIMNLGAMPKLIYERWGWFIVVTAVFGFLINIVIFYPGYMSSDSISQLEQALGRDRLIDLSPPTMTIVWGALIKLTGKISSMLFLQLGMLWAGLCLIAIYVYRYTHSRKLSITVLGVALLPFTINISGVIWKDNQMAFALLMAVAAILYMPVIEKIQWRVALLIGVGLLIMYACLVRYNAAVALIPIIFVMFRQSGLISTLGKQIIATILYCVGLVLVSLLINTVTHAQSSNPINGVMIDDIANINVAYDSKVYQHAPDEVKESISDVRQCAKDKKVTINNIWACANGTERSIIFYKDPGTIKAIWLRSVIENPLQYILYRAYTFSVFLFPPKDDYFIWQDGVVPNNLGVAVKSNRIGEIVNVYVTNFGYKYFSFLFEPWFWLGVNIVLLTLSRRIQVNKHIIIALTVSSILSILSFAPTGATVDYRYVYWPAIAGVISLVVYVIDPRGNLGNSRHTQHVHSI